MQTTASVRTLADLMGVSNRTRDIILVVGASLLTGLVAQWEIRLPWTPVPITLQTFVVFLLAAALGMRRAVLPGLPISSVRPADTSLASWLRQR